MTFRKNRSTMASTLLAVSILSGCGAGTSSGDAPAAGTPQGEAAAPAEEAPPEEETATAEITLPDGWKMQEAITAEEVGAITGQEMQYFAEASSAAQEGQPAAGFTVPGMDYSKIGFHAWVDGGEEKFESAKGFATEGTAEEVSGVGDEAYICDFENGMTAFMVMRGQTVIRIDWFPKTWDQFDKVEFGRELAGKLLEKIYG